MRLKRTFKSTFPNYNKLLRTNSCTMSISLTHTSFAIAGGAGNIGTHVTSALVSQGASVIILSRKDIEAPPGTTARKVDYSNKQSLVEALRGIEVVVSVLSTHGGTDPQVLLADAAKEAGVKLFVPSYVWFHVEWLVR